MLKIQHVIYICIFLKIEIVWRSFYICVNKVIALQLRVW